MTALSDTPDVNDLITNNDTIQNNEELLSLKTELTALKNFVLEQFFIIKKSLPEPNNFENHDQNEYVKSLQNQIEYLKEENNLKSRIIEQLTSNMDINYNQNSLESKHPSDNSNSQIDKGRVQKCNESPPKTDDNNNNKSDPVPVTNERAFSMEHVTVRPRVKFNLTNNSRDGTNEDQGSHSGIADTSKDKAAKNRDNNKEISSSSRSHKSVSQENKKKDNQQKDTVFFSW